MRLTWPRVPIILELTVQGHRCQPAVRVSVARWDGVSSWTKVQRVTAYNRIRCAEDSMRRVLGIVQEKGHDRRWYEEAS